MGFSRKLQLWLTLILVGYLSQRIFPQYDYFPTQNSAFHSAFARNLIEGHLPAILPSSKFEGHYFDQHWVYHALISLGFKVFPPALEPEPKPSTAPPQAPDPSQAKEDPPEAVSNKDSAMGLAAGPDETANKADQVWQPWEVLRLINVMLLSGWGALVTVWFCARGHPPVLGLLVVLAFLSSSSSALNRLFMLRNEILTLVFLSFLILYSDSIKHRLGRWAWLLVFFFGVLSSWYLLVCLAIPFLTPNLNLKKRFMGLSAMVLAFLFTIALRGDLDQGLQYFYSLMWANFTNQYGIYEWQPPPGTPHLLWVVLVGLGVLAISLFPYKNLTTPERGILFYSTLFTLLALKFSRFNMVALALASVCLIGLFPHLLRRYKILKLPLIGAKLPLAFLIVFLIIGVRFIQLERQRPTTFSIERSEIRDLRPFVSWANHNKKGLPTKIALLRWEDWSVLTWYLPQIVFEPGNSVLIYERSIPGLMPCLGLLRRATGSLERIVECLSFIRQALGTNHFLLDRRSVNLIQRLEQVPYLFSVVYDDQDAILIELGEPNSRLINFLVSSRWIPAKDFFIDIRDHLFEGVPFGFRHLSARLPTASYASLDDSNRATAEHLRSAFATAQFCRWGQIPKIDCQRFLERYLALGYRYQNAAVKSFIGQLAHFADNFALASELWHELFKLILPNGAMEQIKYGTSEEIFYPGEILVFLLLTGSHEQIRAVQHRLKSALEFYGHRYLLKRDLFYHRWFAEALALYKVRTSDQSLQHYEYFLIQDIERNHLSRCPGLPRNTHGAAWPGLWLEGLAHLNLPEHLEKSLFYCNLHALTLTPPDLPQGLFFTVWPMEPQKFQIDVHAHSFSGHLLVLEPHRKVFHHFSRDTE